jgi:hypothetical protein
MKSIYYSELLILFFSISSKAQKVFLVNYPNKAGVKVVVSNMKTKQVGEIIPRDIYRP